MPGRKKSKVGRPKGREPLTGKHYEAIELLAEGRRAYGGTHDKLAKKLGISRMMLYKWRIREDFDRELGKALKSRVSEIRRTRPIRNGVSITDLIAKGDEKVIRNILELHDLM